MEISLVLKQRSGSSRDGYFTYPAEEKKGTKQICLCGGLFYCPQVPLAGDSKS